MRHVFGVTFGVLFMLSFSAVAQSAKGWTMSGQDDLGFVETLKDVRGGEIKCKFSLHEDTVSQPFEINSVYSLVVITKSGESSYIRIGDYYPNGKPKMKRDDVRFLYSTSGLEALPECEGFKSKKDSRFDGSSLD